MEVRSMIQRMLFIRPVWAGIMALVFGMSASMASAQIGYRDGFSQSILLGHSFFRPASEEILELVDPTGHSRHTQIRHIAGGTNGDVGALWRDIPAGTGIKAEIEAGGVELFGVAWSPDADDNELEDFTQWIDLVLQYNSNTMDTVFIHSSWVPNSVFGTVVGARLAQNNWNQKIDTLVSQLRTAYPDLTILHMPAGEIMLRLWDLAEQGLLGPEIHGVMEDGNPEYFLQFDSTGHAGWIMVDAMGLMWHKVLYPGYDIRTIQDPATFKFKKDWTYDISQLVHDIYEDVSLAHRYNDTPPVPTAPYFYTSPVVEAAAAEGVAYSGATLGDNAGDINDDSLTFAKVSGPEWLNVATNGALSGIPASGDVGLNPFTVRVSDGIFPSVEETLEISVISAGTRYYSVADGSFENVITNTSSSWDFMNAVWNDDANHEFEVRNADAQDGDHKAYLYRIKTIYQDVGLVNTGETTQVTYWTQGGGTAGDMYCEFLVDGVSQGIQTNALDTAANGEDWTDRTHTVEISRSGTLRLQFYITGSTRCYMDHVSEVAVAPPTGNPTAPAFILDPFSVSDGVAGQAYSNSIAGSATDTDGDPLTYSKVTPGGWLSVASNGDLSGTPNAGYIGDNALSVMVSDGKGGTDTATLEILVLSAPVQPDPPTGTFQMDGAGLAGFTIETSAGIEYRLVYKNELASTNGWLPVTPPFPDGWTNGTGAAMSISDPGSGVNTQRFYRIEARTL